MTGPPESIPTHPSDSSIFNEMERKPKTIYQLDTPFTVLEWYFLYVHHSAQKLTPAGPESRKMIKSLYLSFSASIPPHHTAIKDKSNSILSTLSPIGHHRASIVKSKGKRSRKRKRQEAREKAARTNSEEDSNAGSPLPEIQRHAVVGLNNILRHLQSLSQASKAKKRGAEDVLETSGQSGNKDAQPRPFAAIFALSPTPGNPSIITTHLPTMIHTSSLNFPTLPPTRLIPLSQRQADQLKSILSLARASHVGILDSAPGAEPLIAVIRENVPVMKVGWLDEVEKREYLETKINAIETYVGVSRKEMREKEEKNGVEKH